MKLAIESVQKKEMSIRKASTFMVPKDSLQRPISGKLKSIPADQLHKKLLSSKTKVLSDKQEEELAIYIKEMDQMFYGLSINDIWYLTLDIWYLNMLSKEELKILLTRQKRWQAETLLNLF